MGVTSTKSNLGINTCSGPAHEATHGSIKDFTVQKAIVDHDSGPLVVETNGLILSLFNRKHSLHKNYRGSTIFSFCVNCENHSSNKFKTDSSISYFLHKNPGQIIISVLNAYMIET